MKIKLAILEKDRSYLTRVVSAFGAKYSDKFEIYSFTDVEVALAMLNASKIDVLLAGDVFDIDVARLPKRCAFAYLVDSVGIDMINNQRAICKFQKADMIYKQILSIYSEKASSITGFKMTGDEGKVIGFCSASGGVGSSTMAAACSVYLASKKKKVLYLNLEKYGSADMYFSGQGQFGMSDIIFALKSKKTNLALKLESCVKRDPSGVYFFSQARVALDMIEMNADDTLRLLAELKASGEYDYIVLDMDFGIDKDMLKIYRQTQEIVLVGDGSLESNTKIERAHAALMIVEENADAPLTSRMSFVYNKVGSKTGHTLNAEGLKMLGGAPRYARAEVQQVIEQLAAMDLFDPIL